MGRRGIFLALGRELLVRNAHMGSVGTEVTAELMREDPAWRRCRAGVRGGEHCALRVGGQGRQCLSFWKAEWPGAAGGRRQGLHEDAAEGKLGTWVRSRGSQTRVPQGSGKIQITMLHPEFLPH